MHQILVEQVNQSIQIKKIAEPRKILICHQPTNVKEKPVEMYILLSEWAEHQGHGDILGSCPQVEDPLSSLKYTICHTDPQTGVQSTIIIPASEWPTIKNMEILKSHVQRLRMIK